MTAAPKPRAARHLAALLWAIPLGVGAQQPAPAAPGPEHQALAALVGHWQARVGGRAAGTAEGRNRLDGRFVEVEIQAEAGPITHAIYTFGFDRRHQRYTVIAMDASGTYWVTASGERDGDRIRMEGVDDDPYMTSLGFTKEFIIALTLSGPDAVSIETIYLDTRTQERREMPFLRFDLTRH